MLIDSAVGADKTSEAMAKEDRDRRFDLGCGRWREVYELVNGFRAELIAQAMGELVAIDRPHGHPRIIERDQRN